MRLQRCAADELVWCHGLCKPALLPCHSAARLLPSTGPHVTVSAPALQSVGTTCGSVRLLGLTCAAEQVVSYADLKKCVGGAFGELQMASRGAAPGGFPMGLGGYPRPAIHY